MKIEDLNLDVRTCNAVHRAGCTTVEELKQKLSDDMDGMKRQLGFATFERIEEALTALPQPVDIVEHNVIVSPEYTRAMELHQMIMADKQIIDNGLYRMGKHLKEMRDGKLYKQHGYQNFEDYCKNSVGFNRNQAYAYIRITEKLPEDFVSSTIQIGVQKLSLLAMLDEPTRETVIETVDVENATVKELRNEINRITSENADLGQKLDAANESLSSKSKQFKEAMDAKDKQLKAVKESGEQSLEDCKRYLNSRIHELENRIHDMENAPIDHDMTDADAAEEIKRLKRELEDEQLKTIMLEKAGEAKARRAADEVRHELTKMHETELQTLKDGYEKQLAEKKPTDDEDTLDEARFNSFRLIFEELVDEMENLLEDMEDDPRIAYVKRLDDYWAKNLLYLKSKGAGA